MAFVFRFARSTVPGWGKGFLVAAKLRLVCAISASHWAFVICWSPTTATEDRYGPLPEPVENLFAIQEAKLKLATAGADYLVFRAGKATVGPLLLGSGELRALRSELDTAVYTSARREVSLRSEEFSSAVRLVDAILDARRAA